jgi:hypothetical protein
MNSALLAVALIVLPISAGPQSPKAPHRLSEIERLAVPVKWNDTSQRMFNDSEVSMKFTLSTSWISGPDNKGMLRYKMSAAPVKPPIDDERSNSDPYSPGGIATIVNRAHGCVISVDFYDADEFILRRIDIPFSFGIDSSARVIALIANDFVEMKANEYQKIVEKGLWAISWNCEPPNP